MDDCASCSKPACISKRDYKKAVEKDKKIAFVCWQCKDSINIAFSRLALEDDLPPPPSPPNMEDIEDILDRTLPFPPRELCQRSASSVVEECLHKKKEGCPVLPKPDNMERIANRSRQKVRPKEPEKLSFELNEEFIGEDFLKGDVRVGEARHIIFATSVQLELLSKASRWFIDGTFRVVQAPFVQLVGIHAFIKKDECLKQVPLVFILMSRRTKDDYKMVFERINNCLTANALENVVLDFEKAAWLAIRETYPDVSIKGCVFHLTQAIWRKIQDLGLSGQYFEKGGLYNFCRKLMALPFLPHHSIERAFDNIKKLADSPEIHRLCDYMERTWIDSSVWGPRDWSIYRRSVRTNNDVEGWHQRLNRKAKKANLPFYMLVPLLKEEGSTVELQMTLVNDGLLRRRHRSGYNRVNLDIFQLWEKLDSRLVTTSQFLRECARIYGPGDIANE